MKYEVRYRLDDSYSEECYALVRIDDDGTVTELGRDRGCPEDNLFLRDWDWVAPELNRLAAQVTALRVELRYHRGQEVLHLMEGSYYSGPCKGIVEATEAVHKRHLVDGVYVFIYRGDQRLIVAQWKNDDWAFEMEWPDNG